MKINIVCTIDDSYIQHCGVMLHSLYRNNSQARLTVFIIHNGLKEKSKRKLEKFLRSFIESLSFIKVDDSLLADCPLSHHVSLATYFRLFIPEVLPKDIDKVLFLDSDMIIRKSIIPLWETDVSAYSHAAVESPNSHDAKKRLEIPLSFPYFNAGMLLINLVFWRQEKIFSKAIDFISSHKEKILWWDQDVLNYLLYKYWLPIDPIWNSLGGLWSENFAMLPEASLPAYQLAKIDPTIVHFSGAGACKPWHYYCSHPFTEEYRKNLRQTPWSTARLIDQPTFADRLKAKLRTKIRERMNYLVGKS